MPVEIMLLPRWFPFHLDKVSYWSRTLIAPLVVLMALKPRAKNPRGVGVEELFVTPPAAERDYITNPTGSAWGRFFRRSTGASVWSSPISRSGAGARDRARGRLHHRAAERRGRAGRDLAADRQLGHGLRYSGYPQGPPRS